MLESKISKRQFLKILLSAFAFLSLGNLMGFLTEDKSTNQIKESSTVYGK